MNIKRPTGLPERMRELAKLPGGFRASDLAEFGAEAGRNAADKAEKRGMLFKVKVATKHVRYFGSAADAFASQSAIPKVAPTMKRVPAKQWAADAPINWPRNPDGTPAYKITIAPKPNENTYRTNTHGVSGERIPTHPRLPVEQRPGDRGADCRRDWHPAEDGQQRARLHGAAHET